MGTMINELDQLRYTYLVLSEVTDYRLMKANRFILLTILHLCIMVPHFVWGVLILSAPLGIVTGMFSSAMVAAIFGVMIYKDNLIRQDVEMYCKTVRELQAKDYPMETFYDMNLIR